ncbi:shufflon system plasmid conjugative transfer pilus tip adhesin PilV [Burkholderia multivorans]|uniref:shufflon system plasmid conjugative transfer pilus tip adhesin PilV n=1 Tax=Burkholderia cepacia complex TaxID=87882 RepID=UPI00018E39AF|nr:MULTISPECIES: shufflon system plasmid conjugative transfer pilus tip adhesin PilV [Burkholderia cepacia complex]EED97296.1 putative adhesin [Burkholderia multivorans CGD1]PRE22549.1 shufflon system plasmid conjugative transfer pilus tip adhesin PilV [Burkholderia multivorans]PRF42407.1 shufflon system plasmid conjugative transfer pilus tip adhesin PilV [Burkholderia multivorans]QSL64017.1 shufflon system plasmid conjugative transfer pilus tip adhesin PilV [Burkholderia multivorans]HEJ244003
MEAILGFLAALALSTISVGSFLGWSVEGAKNVKAAVTAGQAREFNSAAEKYVKDFASVLAQSATAGAPLIITPGMLRNAGYLNQAVSDTNAYQQTWVLQVRQPVPGQLQAIVTAEGAAIEPRQLVKIASNIYQRGGFVPYPRQMGDSTMDANTAVGTNGGWHVPMAGWRSPGSGHLVSLLTFGGAASSSNGYLYRVSVPGRPDLNEMQTALGMRGNDINNVGVLRGASGAFSGRVATSGLDPNDLPSGWGGGLRTWDIYAGGTIAAGNGGSTPVGMSSAGNMWANTFELNAGAQHCGWNQVQIRNNNQMFICNANGDWVPASNLVGNLTTTAQYSGYYNGWGVTPPTCGPGGSPWFSITPVTTGVEFANHNPPLSGAVYQMGWNGSQWVLQIYDVLADGNRSRINDELGLQADIRVGCSFGNGA